MSKKIIVNSKNGADNIDKSRQATNRSNLEEDRKDWQKIVDGDQKNKLIPTLRSRLEKNYEHQGFARKEDIDFKAIQNYARDYLKLPHSIVIDYCRDSTRQSIDEAVQTATLKKYVNDSFENITNGREVPFNGKLLSKKEAVGLNGKQINARSVDAIGVVGKYKVKIFQKYSKVSGSGQSHQALEAQNWIEECKKIKLKDTLFVVQLDGAEAERHIPALSAIINNSNMFVGNSEQIIDWLNNK